MDDLDLRDKVKEIMREEIDGIIREKSFNIFGASLVQIRRFFINIS